MFADAYEMASSFTEPVVVSTRLFDGQVKCGCGAFVVVNDEGWVLTAAHLLNSYFASKQHSTEISDYQKQVSAIESDPNLNAKKKGKKTARLKVNPEWITNHSFWWGRDGVTIQDVVGYPSADLVLGRLEPFDSSTVQTYPVIKNPSSLRLGTSLCRLGYPFHEITASFDETSNNFTLAPGTLPLPRFPIEGIYTRNFIAGRSPDGQTEIKFLETSSPGLRGQSGGPIFDQQGTVWGIQSHTRHFPLGFSPKVVKKGKEVEENQFLNVGLGAHPETIVQFLNENNIKFTMSGY